MDPDAAGILLAAITALGTVVWLVALRFLIASAHKVPGRRAQALGDADQPAEGHEGWLTGNAEVEGDPSTLASRAAAVLASA